VSLGTGSTGPQLFWRVEIPKYGSLVADHHCPSIGCGEAFDPFAWHLQRAEFLGVTEFPEPNSGQLSFDCAPAALRSG
jgi:hypothetical protein